jgi:hypothetical protein
MTEEIKLPKIPRPDSKPPAKEAVLQPVQSDLEVTGIGGAVVMKEEAQPEPEPEPTPQGDPRFELRLTETKADVGSIPITWCVDKEWLFKNSNSEQYVLLASAPPENGGDKAEWRGHAKLSDMMAYVTLYRPGKNRIIARVSDKAEIDEWVTRSRYGDRWQSNVMAFPESHWSDARKEKCKYMLTKGWRGADRLWNYLDIDMPTGCFAKEPSDTEKKWVNFFFKNKAVDQCEFRRRRMLAYTVQPIVFSVIFIFYALAISCIQLFNLMIGKWTIWEKISAFKIDRRVDFLTIKKLGHLRYLLLPVPWLTTAAYVIFWFTHLMRWLLIPPAYLLAIPILFGMITLIMLGFDFLIAWSIKRSPRIRAARERKIELERLRRLALYKAELEALDLLLCSSGKRITRFRDLPKNKRTIKLRFEGIKSLVCRPFAR